MQVSISKISLNSSSLVLKFRIVENLGQIRMKEG